ncbi:MAG: right-handed parallel beta-helix repeat-containing protein [Clostridia bacterium]|nr:right-handed parallel beta-helix repeat-containing protein [Clostridia bacterium]
MAIKIIQAKKTVVTAQTAEEIRENILELAREAQPGGGDCVEVLLSGVYRPVAPLVFSTDENPELANISLSFRVPPSNNAIFASLNEVKGAAFTPVPGKPYYTYQYEKDENGNYPLFHDFFCNSRRLKMAKSPVWRNPFALLPEERKGEKKLEGLYAPLAIAKEIKEGGIGCTELRMYVQWEHYILRVKDVDLSATKEVNGETYALVTFFEEFDENFVKGVHIANNIGNRETFFTNNLAYLTEPDTFVYDWHTGTVYVVPDSEAEMRTRDLGYAHLSSFFVFKGMKNVTIEGLRFRGATSTYVCENSYCAGLSNNEKRAERLREAAILASDVKDFTVKNCNFRFLGSNGVQMCDNVVRGTVVDCQFEDIAMAGVSVGNFNRDWCDPKNRLFNIKIVNNSFKNIAYDYPNTACIFLGISDGSLISHNSIDGCGYSGIFVGHGWSPVRYEPGEYVNMRACEISYNKIHNFMDVCRDGAAIYATGGNATRDYTERFNSIHHNYAYLDQSGHTDRRGYYLDGATSHWQVNDNVIDNCQLPLFTQYHVPAQYTYHCTVANLYSTTAVDAANHNPHNDVICENIVVEPSLEELFEKHPEAKAIAEGAGIR